MISHPLGKGGALTSQQETSKFGVELLKNQSWGAGRFFFFSEVPAKPCRSFSCFVFGHRKSHPRGAPLFEMYGTPSNSQWRGPGGKQLGLARSSSSRRRGLCRWPSRNLSQIGCQRKLRVFLQPTELPYNIQRQEGVGTTFLYKELTDTTRPEPKHDFNGFNCCSSQVERSPVGSARSYSGSPKPPTSKADSPQGASASNAASSK